MGIPFNNIYIRVAAISLYSLLLVYISVNAYKKPFYNGDILSYSALILRLDNPADTNVKLSKMLLLKKEIPAKRYEQLVAKAHNKSLLIANSKPNDHLPFYIVKPLYVLACFMFYKLGVPLAASTVCPSILAYIAIGMLMMVWLNRHYKTWLAALLSGIIISWDTFVNMARLSTPDALSAFFVFIAAFYLVERKSYILTYIMLVLAVFTRLDNMIPATAMALIPVLTNATRHNVKVFLLSVAGFGACAFIMAYMVYLNGWSLLFFPSYFQRLNISGKATKEFNFQEYFQMIRLGLVYASSKSHIVKFFVLMLSYSTLINRKWDIEKWLVLVLLVVMVVRFFLHPLTVDRFYLGYYLIFIVLTLKGFVEFGKYKSAKIANNR